MPELDLQIDGDASEVNTAPKRPETKRVLNVSVQIDDDADAVEILQGVQALGRKIISVNLNDQYDYGALY